MQNLKVLSEILLDNYRITIDMKKECTRVLLGLASPLVLSVVKMYFIPTEFFIRREKKHQFGSPERVFNAVQFSAGRGVHETLKQ